MTTATNANTAVIELQETRSFTIGDIDYLLGPAVVAELPPTLVSQLSGAVVLLVHSETLRSFTLQATLQYWSEKDDVYKAGLESHIIVVGINLDLPTGLESARVSYLTSPSHEARPLEGPYYVLEQQLIPVRRVYRDTQEAFTLAIQPQSISDPCFHSLRYFDDREHRMIAVPSRIPSLGRETLPLSGIRLSVKDNINLKGLQTGLSSKAWQKHHPPEQTTSPLITRLVDQGAVVVGKTKLSQFGVLEFPTAEWIDVHAPWNPRGDEYLSPGGSTSGGAAALAAYPWLDASIGTDRSIRKPAAHNGLFALRPTTPKEPIAGIFPLASNLDAPGFLARDIGTLKRVVKAALPNLEQQHNFTPKRIHVIREDFIQDQTPIQAAATSLVNKFIQDLADYTHAETLFAGLQTMFHEDNFPDRETLEKMYNAGCPPSQEEDLIQRIIDQQAVETIKHFLIAQRLKKFAHEYRNTHGENPYLGPVMQGIIQNGRRTKRAKYYKALKLMKKFSQWFTTKLEGSIAIYQLSDNYPEHRDLYIGDPSDDLPSSRVPNSFISPMAACPEVVVPIGQIPYLSKVTKKEEQLPLVVSIIGPPGSDLALLDFITDFLKSSGGSLSVKTGRLAFDHIEPMIPRLRAGSFDLLGLNGSFLSIDEASESMSPPSRPSLDDRSLVVVSDVEHGTSDEDALLTGDEMSSGEEILEQEEGSFWNRPQQRPSRRLMELLQRATI